MKSREFLGHFTAHLATHTLITLNILAYLFVAFFSRNFVDIPPQILYGVGGVFGPSVVLGGEWYRVGSSLFLHASITHLLMNMVSLYIVGKILEELFGRLRFLILYFFSGVIGAMVSLYFHTNSIGIGASGAIFGIFGGLIGFYLAHKNQLRSQSTEFFKQVAILLGINILMGVMIPEIDIYAHIGGLVVGIIGGLLFALRVWGVWLFVGVMSLVMVGLYGILVNYYMGLVAS